MSKHVHHGGVLGHGKDCCVAARNKRHHIINLMAWEHEANTQRIIDAAQQQNESAVQTKKDDSESSWTERSDKIRDRLTGKRKKAKARWSGFGGTSGGPSRGR